MKKYKEIREEIVKLEKKNKGLTDKLISISDARKNIESLSERKAQREKNFKVECELSERIKDNNITIKILNNNAKVALFTETIPIIIDELNLYKGKRYGEKTEEKVEKAVLERTGNIFYISKGHFEKMVIRTRAFPYDEVNCGVKCQNGKEGRLIDSENRINEITLDDMEIYYIDSEYVENITERAEKIKKSYKEILDKQQELREVIEKFNGIAVGFNHISDKNYFRLE